MGDPEKIVWFNGFHTCYLKDEQESTVNPFKKLGLEPPVVFVRPEPEFATFFNGHEPVLEKSVELIAKSGNASIAVLPRTEAQRRHYSKVRDVTVLDESISDCPVAHVDVALGAAETMLMEAFVMGKPSVSAIYWPASKPVVELHRYIPHSTEPTQIAQHVVRMLDVNEKEAFREMAAVLVRNMDNPVRMMIDEIHKINDGDKENIVFARRSRIEIFLDIIQSTSLRPLRLTHIMRDANISHNELKKFLATLEGSGLITSELSYGGRLYQATGEGLKVLEDYRGIRRKLFAEQ